MEWYFQIPIQATVTTAKTAIEGRNLDKKMDPIMLLDNIPVSPVSMVLTESGFLITPYLNDIIHCKTTMYSTVH